MDDGSEHKNAKGTKKCVIKRRLMFENYKDCLINENTIFKRPQRFKSYYHDMYTEEINKVALSSNDNKRIQTFDKVTTFPKETPAAKVCENEMLSICNAKEISKILSKECENELYVTCNLFSNYMKTKCASETPAVKVCENEMLSICKTKEISKILSKECENELYVTCNLFLNYMTTKYAMEMKKHVKFGVKKMLGYLARYK